MSSNSFEVEKILNKRLKNGKTEYFLKWRGFSPNHNSWVVDDEYLNCDELKKQFEISQFNEIIAVRRNTNNIVDYLVHLKKEEPKVHSSSEMRKKWPEKTIKFLEKMIEYVSGNPDQADANTTNNQTVHNCIGKPIRVLYVAKVGKKLIYYIKFENAIKFLASDNACALCPDLLLDYLESNLQAA